MGRSETTHWPCPMNCGSTSHFSVPSLGLSSRDTGGSPCPWLSGPGAELSFVTILSQYRVGGWWDNPAMSKALGTPSRKREFFSPGVKESFWEEETFQLCLEGACQRKPRKRTQEGRSEKAARRGRAGAGAGGLLLPAFRLPERPQEPHRFSAVEHAWFPAPTRSRASRCRDDKRRLPFCFL